MSAKPAHGDGLCRYLDGEIQKRSQIPQDTMIKRKVAIKSKPPKTRIKRKVALKKQKDEKGGDRMESASLGKLYKTNAKNSTYFQAQLPDEPKILILCVTASQTKDHRGICDTLMKEVCEMGLTKEQAVRRRDELLQWEHTTRQVRHFLDRESIKEEQASEGRHQG